MNNIGNKYFDIGYLDSLSYRDSVLHRLDPRAMLITTVLFIVAVVSSDKYSVSALTPFFIFPIFLLALGGLPAGYLLKKVLLVSPFAVLVGIFNPIFDKQVILHIGQLGISGGWVSFISIIIRFILTVSSALVLIALSGFNSVCASLERFGLPKPLVVQLLLFYRYIFVLTDEAERMLRAAALRMFKRSSVGFKVFTGLAGNLLLRSLGRAERVYCAMRCRGFDGNIRFNRVLKFGFYDFLFVAVWSFLFLLFRFNNIPQKLGMMLAGVIK